LGSLCGFHPFILSVWGSDIFEFPHTSILARLLIRYNLRKADRILSTSNALAEETRKYTSKKIEITPFGIDLEKFKPFPVEPLFSQETIVIGTVKALEAIYGIEYLIEAFGILVHKYPLEKLRLLIVGGGPQELFLKEKAAALGLKDSIVFTGRIPHQQVPEYLNMIDIFAALSIIESFGVAVVEAGACELPVVVTNTGGLKEVVQDHVTGLLVPPKDVEKTASAFEMLLLDPALRKTMGKQGRERISRLYNWDDNVDGMIRIYQQFR
jgi:glycosyltransferase involved in cell wall biosynthesis